MIYLTPAEVAELLKVSPKTVSRWALEDPSMPVTRLGRTVRFELEALERWLRAHSRRKAAPSTTQVAATAAEDHLMTDQAPWPRCAPLAASESPRAESEGSGGVHAQSARPPQIDRTISAIPQQSPTHCPRSTREEELP